MVQLRLNHTKKKRGAGVQQITYDGRTPAATTGRTPPAFIRQFLAHDATAFSKYSNAKSQYIFRISETVQSMLLIWCSSITVL